jgi:hypothetical protein
MNKRIGNIILLSAVLAAAAVSVTGAAEKHKSKGMPVKSAPFSVAGVYSGSLDGEILVSGQSVFITDKTSFQKVGKGPVEKGESLSKTAVMISGVMKGKTAIATMVLISERETSNDYSQTTIESTKAIPRPRRGSLGPTVAVARAASQPG